MRNLTCPSCQQPYSVKFYEETGPLRHPLLLRCGHTFCLVCVQKLKAQGKNESIACPTCQASIEVKGAELYRYISPDIFTVGQMWRKRLNLEIQSQKISERPSAKGRRRERMVPEEGPGDEGVITCSECLVNSAVCQCFRCEGVMCRPCFDKIHQRSLTLKKHQAVALTSFAVAERNSNMRVIMPTKARQRHCSSHDQCQIEYYCEDDNQPICSRCVIMGEHKGHNVQTMEDKNKSLLAEMESAVVETQETIWRLEKSEKLVRENMPSVTVNTELMDDVRHHFMGLHSLLQAREEELLDDIKEASNAATNSFQEMRAHLQAQKVALEEALMDAARAKHGSLHRLVDADCILERLKKAKDLPCVITIQKDALTEPIEFIFGESLKETLQEYGGVTIAKSFQLMSLKSAGPDAEKPPAEELKSYTVADLDLDSQSTTDSTSMSGSTAVEGNKNESDSEEEQRLSAEVIDVKTLGACRPPVKELVPGHTERVNVTHICSPGQFVVQLIRDQPQIHSLHQKINAYCRNSQSRKTIPQYLDIGSLVLAQYAQDRQWYRGRVTSVIQSKNAKGDVAYEVCFVDYGNSAVVPRNKLRKMQKRFTALGVFGYECALFDILPVDEKKGWTTESADTMLQMTQGGGLHMMVVNAVGGRLEVDLGKPDGEDCLDGSPVSVRDSLVFLEMAVFNTHSPHGIVPAMRKRCYLTLPLVDADSVVNMGINCTHSPSHFYAQMYNEECHGHLQRLLLSMQEVYRQETKHLYKVFCPRMDMICVARYAKDNNWYRARVTGIPGHRKVEVEFVDYGNREVVDHSDICKILDDHIKYPMQALKVSLADVAPAEYGQWSEKAKEWFRSVTELQLCQFRVTEWSETPNTLVGLLYAINSDTNRPFCVNYELVKRGFAVSTGRWTAEEHFGGITLSSEMLAAKSSSSSESSSPMSGTYRIGSPALLQTPGVRVSGKGQPSPRKRRGLKERPSPVSAPTSPLFTSANGHTVKTGTAPPPQDRQDGREMGIGESAQLAEGAVEVVISGYCSPVEFFVQLVEKQQDLSRLMEDMRSYEGMLPSSHTWTAGQFCAVKSGHDQRWYRGCIQSVKDDNKYEVKLVDFGHIDIIPANSVKPLKRDHGKEECFAERCHIANLMPAGTTDRTKWSRTAIEFMSKLIGLKRTYIVLKGDRVPDMGLPVDMLVEETTPATALEPEIITYSSVSAKLEDRGLAIPTRTQKNAQSEASGASPSKAAMFNTKPTPTFSGTEEEEREESNHSRFDEVSVAEEAITANQSNLVVAPHPPPPSTQLQVIPVHVDSAGIIYAQDIAEAEGCQEMIDALERCTQSEGPEGAVLEVEEGQLCVAFCPAYNVWLRACILKVDDDHVEVKYIDYGNTGQVPRTQLKAIPHDLCVRHQLVYEMRLKDVSPISGDGTWPEEYYQFLNTSVINHPFTALIQGSVEERPLLVELFDEKNGVNIQTALVGSMEQDMEVFYQRSIDVANIVKLPSPYTNLKLGNKDESVHAFVTHMELPNIVFLQRCETPSDPELSQELADFAQLMSDLNNLPPQTPRLRELPTVGQMCSAHYSRDNCWYRGLVVKVFPQDRLSLILYVDYGNSEVVPLDRLRVLPPRFQDMPVQSVRAYLNVTLPKDCSRWTMDTYRTMAQSIYLRQHRVVIKETMPLLIELYEPEGTALSYEPLILKGLVAVPRPDENPCMEGAADASDSDEEGSTTSLSPEQE